MFISIWHRKPRAGRVNHLRKKACKERSLGLCDIVIVLSSTLVWYGMSVTTGAEKRMTHLFNIYYNKHTSKILYEQLLTKK